MEEMAGPPQLLLPISFTQGKGLFGVEIGTRLGWHKPKWCHINQTKKTEAHRHISEFILVLTITPAFSSAITPDSSWQLQYLGQKRGPCLSIFARPNILLQNISWSETGQKKFLQPSPLMLFHLWQKFATWARSIPQPILPTLRLT